MPSTEQLTGNVTLPKLSVSTDGGSVYNAVAELIADPTPVQPSRDSIETTHSDLTDGYKTFLPGWADGGEASFSFNYTETTYSALLLLDGVVASFKLEWTDTGDDVTDPSMVWDGFITSGPTKSMPLADRQTIDISVKVSGKPVFTPGTATP
jgi:hypothetical protein